MTITIKSNPDGVSGAIQVNDVDRVTIGASGITAGSFAPNSIDAAAAALAFSGANQSLASSGYQKLPSGLIIQWGTTNTAVAANTSTSMTWTFPIAFPNACLFATASPGDFVTSSRTSESWTTTSATGFAQHSSAQTLRTLWFAIGN